MNRKASTFLALAEQDIGHARDNLRSHPRHAAWSIEQAAEKMVKAVLTAEGADYPATSHQLDDLVRRVTDANPFRADFLELTRLTPAATRYRYPTPRGDIPADPPMAETAEDLERVSLLLPEVRAWLAEGG
jgi:HEPN domain-containing protein